MSKEYNSALQARVEQFLKEKNISQAKAAPLMGISQTALSQYRRSMYDNGNIGELENKLMEFFRTQEEQEASTEKALPYRPTQEYIPTSISEDVYKMRGAMGNQLQYENRAMRRGQAASLDADLDGLEAVTLYDLLPGSSGAEEQAVFEMLVCSLASGLTGTEKAVLRLTTEGYGRGEIARKLGIPHQQVKDSLAVLQRRCAEEQITEAV